MLVNIFHNLVQRFKLAFGHLEVNKPMMCVITSIYPSVHHHSAAAESEPWHLLL